MDGPHKQVIRIVQEYLDESLTKISFWQGYSLAQSSYSRWAATELLKILQDKENIPPLIILEDFKSQMDNYACMNRASSYIFSVAYDMAECIIDQLL